MRTDLYTKTVLTVIAIALVAIVIKDINFFTPAKASLIEELEMSNNKEDQKKDKRKITDVNIVQINGVDVGYNQEDGQIPVYITNKNTPVYIKGIPYVKVANYYDFKEGGGMHTHADAARQEEEPEAKPAKAAKPSKPATNQPARPRR